MERDDRLMEDLDELLLELVDELDDNERCRWLCLLDPEDEEEDDEVEYRRRWSLDLLRRTVRRLCKKYSKLVFFLQIFYLSSQKPLSKQ